jgi:hypothetical protein
VARFCSQLLNPSSAVLAAIDAKEPYAAVKSDSATHI